MADADKCYLRIPYKEWAKNQDGISDVAAEQEFQNLKAIENRINDPECTGGACDCMSWVGYSKTVSDGFSTGTTIDMLGQSFKSLGVTGWTTVESQGNPPQFALYVDSSVSFADNGWYQIDVQAQPVSDSGSGDVQFSLSAIHENLPLATSNQAWGQSTWFPDTMPYAYNTISFCYPFNVGDEFRVNVDFRAAAAITRSWVVDVPFTADQGRMLMSIHKICGCLSAH